MIAGAGATVLGASGIALTGCAASAEAEAAPEPLTSGAVLATLADLAVGATLAVTVQGHDLVLSRSGEDEVAAVSAICTHKGCTVVATPTELECPCHGSRFETTTGTLINGPAKLPLTPIAVAIRESNIVVA